MRAAIPTVVLAAALALAAGACARAQVGEACEQHADCAEGALCSGARCKIPLGLSCQRGQPCVGEAQCLGGVCRERCEHLVALLTDCGEAKYLEQAPALVRTLCEAGKSPAFSDDAACAVEADGDCLAFRACRLAGEGRRAVAAVRAELARADGQAATAQCRGLTDDVAAQPAVAQACKDAWALAHRELTEEVTALRDGREDSDDPEVVCRELEGAAERVSPQAAAEAKALCGQVAAGAKVAAAIAAANANREQRKRQIPFKCKAALEALPPRQGAPAWAARARREVVDACYVALGKDLLTALVPDAKSCPYQVRDVLEAAADEGIADAVFGDLLPPARALCPPRAKRGP